jgi:hypothetical protein
MVLSATWKLTTNRQGVTLVPRFMSSHNSTPIGLVDIALRQDYVQR